MQKKIISYATTVVMLLALVAILLLGMIKIRPLLLDFETEKIASSAHRDTRQADVAGHLLDQVLMQQLQHFKYIKSFNHLFTGDGQKKTLPAMAVDQCEVSQAEFKKFARWTKTNKEFDMLLPGQPYDWEFFSNTEKHLISGRLAAAANGVTYYDAYAYCAAAGGRLPYSDEWVAIASGGQQNIYPWGQQFNKTGWPYLNPLLNAAQRCGLHNETDTEKKISDLGHNVSEWAQDRSNPAIATIHGGNAYNQPYELYSLNHLYRYAPQDYRSPYIGFRCVYTGTVPAQSPWGTDMKTVQLATREYRSGLPIGANIPQLIVHLPKEHIDHLQDMLERKKEIDVNPFSLMKYEVSRAQYASFLSDPLVKLGLYADRKQPLNHSYVPNNWPQQMQNPERPVTHIDWWSAYAFAKWAGGRLPSAEEWALAASSNGQLIYPWGHEFVSSYSATIESRLTQASASGRFAKDQTTAGIFDMGGNVSEWTQSIDLSHDGYAIITKGGNYKLPGKESARIDFTNRVPAGYRSPSIGFRVAF